jgi:hypothetical protein
MASSWRPPSRTASSHVKHQAAELREEASASAQWPSRTVVIQSGDPARYTCNVTAGYSGTPLPVKLGIKSTNRVLLLGAPELPELQPLPEGVTVQRRAGKLPYDVILLFCPDKAALHRRFTPTAALLSPAGALWTCWLKKASGIATDLSDNDVRTHGLASGLVDIKVAAIDANWSGLKFVHRLRDR